MSEIKISVPAAITATQLFASTDESRYYLHGVLYEPHPDKGAIMVATNGHVLSVFYDEDATPPEKPTIINIASKEFLASCVADKDVETCDEWGDWGRRARPGR